MARLIEQDTRFWEVFNEKGESQGIHMYGDMIGLYSVGGGTVLKHAYAFLKEKGWTCKIIGDVVPLEEDSDNPVIQKKKIEFRRRERRRLKKQKAKHGYKLNSAIKFGKYKGLKTIKQIIEQDPGYWNWLVINVKMLLHEEVIEFISNKK